jgi:hypothetical protein
VELERHNEGDYDMYDPYYEQPTRHHSPLRAWESGGIKPFSRDLRMVIWPPNFMSLAIDKYDGSNNPVECLEVYQLTIEVAGGDSYVMANYLPIFLLSSTGTWLMGLPTGSV